RRGPAPCNPPCASPGPARPGQRHAAALNPTHSLPKEPRMKLVSPEACPLQEKFATTRRELAAALIERDDEIDLVLTALLAQEHLLLVGPPGCAKSLLLDSVLAWLRGRRFSILLNRFTTPEEVLGPVSVAGL